MAIRSGRVVRTPEAEKPYKVVLEHDPTGFSEHPVATVREGEALIRERMVSAPPDPSLDWHI